LGLVAHIHRWTGVVAHAPRLASPDVRGLGHTSPDLRGRWPTRPRPDMPAHRENGDLPGRAVRECIHSTGALHAWDLRG